MNENNYYQPNGGNDPQHNNGYPQQNNYNQPNYDNGYPQNYQNSYSQQGADYSQPNYSQPSYSQPSYSQPSYNGGYQQPNMPPVQYEGDSEAKTAMITGIISLVASIIAILFFWGACLCTGANSYSSSAQVAGFYVGMIVSGVLSVAGVITGIIAMVKASKYNKIAAQTGNYASKSKATTGMVCGVIGLIIAALSVISCVSCFGCAVCAIGSVASYGSSLYY